MTQAAPKKRPAKPTVRRTPRLLAGGNPQIAKGAGNDRVRAYIDSIPDWKRKTAQRVDLIVTRAIPRVRKAVKYNSPLYGADGRDDWFLSLHCFKKYLKLAFFSGSLLTPEPPGRSKQERVRYLDIREEDAIDSHQLTAWVQQASQLPGQKL